MQHACQGVGRSLIQIKSERLSHFDFKPEPLMQADSPTPF
jgi:hypothetical protein